MLDYFFKPETETDRIIKRIKFFNNKRNMYYAPYKQLLKSINRHKIGIKRDLIYKNIEKIMSCNYSNVQHYTKGEGQEVFHLMIKDANTKEILYDVTNVDYNVVFEVHLDLLKIILKNVREYKEKLFIIDFE